MAQSCYFRCLQPYLDTFPREQLCVVSLEDLVAEGSPAWSNVLGHLGLSPIERPTRAYNVTAEQRPSTPAMRWLRDLGLAPRCPVAIDILDTKPCNTVVSWGALASSSTSDTTRPARYGCNSASS